MKPYLEEKEAVLAEAGSGMEGLSDEEAAARLSRDGPNKLKEGQKESLLKKFLGELKDPMTIVLIAAAAGGALVLLLATSVLGIMPFMLAFAAGAMLYVVVEELIPEYSQGRHSNLGTVGFALGFALMMVLDVVLG